MKKMSKWLPVLSLAFAFVYFYYPAYYYPSYYFYY
ncbi:MAG: hypothetical protein K0R57_2234 [Paenibacillaceae bacterium]|jgi:hypothetical protein|nr:hypothetical protein [Paenibacillaceae bacterium]